MNAWDEATAELTKTLNDSALLMNIAARQLRELREENALLRARLRIADAKLARVAEPYRLSDPLPALCRQQAG